MTSGFIKRQIDLKLRLGTGSFGESGENTVTATGLRVNATITKTGAVGMHSLEATVYGLDPSIATQISTLGKQLLAGRNNLISLSAGDANSGMAVVFIGTIITSWSDYSGAPEVGVQISAKTGALDSVRPLPPTSFQGGADVATIIAGLAQQMGYAFENSGVSVQLRNPYFAGAGREQAYAAAAAAHVHIVIDDQPNALPTIAIWPWNGTRGGAIPNISPQSGMVGYPRWTDQGVDVQSVFNPSIVVGGKIQISNSFVKNANGVWPTFLVTHELESEDPDGPWFTSVRCYFPGGPPSSEPNSHMSDTQSYPGTGSPFDYGSLFNAISFIAQQMQEKNWTSTLVQVVAVHPGEGMQGGSVDVHPLVNQVDSQGNATPHGTIFGIPYHQTQAGTSAVVVVPAVGDLGECSFASHDISSVLASSAQANPGSSRRFSPSDAIYRGAVASINPAPTTFVQVADGSINITAVTAVTVTAPEVTVVSDNVSLGASGGPAVARVGDSVDLGTGLITTGSAKVTSA